MTFPSQLREASPAAPGGRASARWANWRPRPHLGRHVSLKLLVKETGKPKGAHVLMDLQPEAARALGLLPELADQADPMHSRM